LLSLLNLIICYASINLNLRIFAGQILILLILPELLRFFDVLPIGVVEIWWKFSCLRLIFNAKLLQPLLSELIESVLQIFGTSLLFLNLRWLVVILIRQTFHLLSDGFGLVKHCVYL